MAEATGSCVLLNYFVGGRQQSFRDGEAERLGGLEVDDEFEFGRLQDRQVGGLFTFRAPRKIDFNANRGPC